ELQNEIHKLEKEIAVLRIQHDALGQESLRNVTDTESKVAELDQFNVLVADLEGQTAGIQQAYDRASEAETALQAQIADAEASILSLKDGLVSDNRQL